MLHVTYVNSRKDFGKDGYEIMVNTEESFISHVGEKLKTIDPTTIIALYADGDELEYINKNFTNIPVKLFARGMTWRGFIAAFIFENW